MLFADYGFSIFAGCYFATEETIEDHKDAAGRRSSRASGRASRPTSPTPRSGTKYTIDIYGKDIGLDPAQQHAPERGCWSR